MGMSKVECRVGALVWVRRRNGSWWPGRVVGPNDLSLSHLIRRRPGFPVKLLGGGNPTVDWYNLEQSKRIKAFRCGEFDDCIERVKSSQAKFSKKIVKYARRTGAILHALQLEKKAFRKKLKVGGEKRTASICQPKRSRPAYLLAESNNCSKRSAFQPELLHISSSTFEMLECSLQSTSVKDDTSSRSMKSDSSERHSRGPDRVKGTTQLSALVSGYLEDPRTHCIGPVCADYYHEMETTLTEVELTVRASYRGERVPLLSLMSRTNGKAIVGHQINIEALDDGSSEILLAKKHDIGHKLFNNSGSCISTMLQPVWRTSRRTPVCYVSQNHPPLSQKDDKNAQASQNPGLLSLKAMTNGLPPTQECLRKHLEKPSLLSIQKTRTLASFATEKEHHGDEECLLPIVKQKDGVPARATCVPVKLIFSKLLVAVGGVQS